MIGAGNYAGLAVRFFALTLDFLLLSAFFFPATRIVKGVWLMSPSDHHWGIAWVVFDPICAAFLGIIVLYFIILEGVVGATFGKWVLRIRVVGRNGGKPGLKKSLLRNVLRLVDTLPALNILGVVLILRSPERARFGDRVAGTRVIYRQGV